MLSLVCAADLPPIADAPGPGASNLTADADVTRSATGATSSATGASTAMSGATSSATSSATKSAPRSNHVGSVDLHLHGHSGHHHRPIPARLPGPPKIPGSGDRGSWGSRGGGGGGGSLNLDGDAVVVVLAVAAVVALVVLPMVITSDHNPLPAAFPPAPYAACPAAPAEATASAASATSSTAAYREYFLVTGPAAAGPGLRSWSARAAAEIHAAPGDGWAPSLRAVLQLPARVDLCADATRLYHERPSGALDLDDRFRPDGMAGVAALVRFAQAPWLLCRAGPAVQLVVDDGLHVGPGFSYAVDIFPGRPLVCSAQWDWAWLADRDLRVQRWRASTGLIFDRSEVYIGIQHLAVGEARFAGPFGGLRVWF